MNWTKEQREFFERRNEERAAEIAHAAELRASAKLQSQVAIDKATQQQLAAANALLTEWRNSGDRDPYVGLRDRTDAYLAAQPATAPCSRCYNSVCSEHQPATAPARTEAEQAVLDACAAEPSDFTLLELVRNTGWTWVRNVAKAELARRGLK